MNINTVHLCGNLVRDPESKFLANEKCVAKFTLAVNRTWKDANGEKKEEVTFVDIEAWGRTAELCGQYLTKGSECYVQGRLKLDTWEKDGQKHSKLRVVADAVQFGRKPSGSGGSASARGPDESGTSTTDRPRSAPSAPPAGASQAAADDEPPF